MNICIGHRFILEATFLLSYLNDASSEGETMKEVRNRHLVMGRADVVYKLPKPFKSHFSSQPSLRVE